MDESLEFQLKQKELELQGKLRDIDRQLTNINELNNAKEEIRGNMANSKLSDEDRIDGDQMYSKFRETVLKIDDLLGRFDYTDNRGLITSINQYMRDIKNITSRKDITFKELKEKAGALIDFLENGQFKSFIDQKKIYLEEEKFGKKDRNGNKYKKGLVDELNEVQGKLNENNKTEEEAAKNPEFDEAINMAKLMREWTEIDKEIKDAERIYNSLEDPAEGDTPEVQDEKIAKKGQQKSYIEELKRRAEQMKKSIEEKEKQFREKFDKNKDDLLKDLKNQLDYLTSTKEALEENLNNLQNEPESEKNKDEIEELKIQIKDCNKSINFTKEKIETIEKANAGQVIKRTAYALDLIDMIQERINSFGNDRSKLSITDKNALRGYENLLNLVYNNIKDVSIDDKTFENNIDIMKNNLKLKDQVINVGGYDMTREQALAELATLKARLSNVYDNNLGEDFLDSLDDPDMNQQAILNRIAELERALGLDRGREDGGKKEPGDPKGPKPPRPTPPTPPTPTPTPTPPTPTPPTPTPPQNGLVRSGLQIFRDEFNKMPEIKRRHTASERMPFYQTILGVGGIVATATLGPLGLIPIALAPTLGPISRLVSGQNKIEKQIADQFRDLERNNPNEFDRMVDYISEERIQDLKPNAVILRALHKVQTERTAKQLKILQAESDRLEDQRDRILQKAQNNPGILSDTEKNNLAYITARLKQINEGSYGVDENGKEAKIEAEVERIQRRFKELKRGKDRVSQRYKGNLATRFNIFAHRNSDTKHYKEPLNELADAELARDITYSKGNYEDAAAYDKKMKEIAQEYTHTNFAGVQNSVFNKRTGTGRIISDRHDNTYKNIFNIATLLGVGAATHQAANIARQGQQVNVNLTGSKDVAQKAADGVRGDTYMQGEVAAIRGNGTTTAPGYHNADKLANEWGNKAQTTITSNKISEQLKQIANAIRGNKEAAQAVQDTSSKQLGFVKNGFKYDVDHTGQLENLARYAENNEAKASMLENAAKTIEALEANSSQMATNMNNLAKKAFIGPILAGLGVLHRGASDFVNGIKEKRTNTKASGER